MYWFVSYFWFIIYSLRQIFNQLVCYRFTVSFSSPENQYHKTDTQRENKYKVVKPVYIYIYIVVDILTWSRNLSTCIYIYIYIYIYWLTFWQEVDSLPKLITTPFKKENYVTKKWSLYIFKEPSIIAHKISKFWDIWVDISPPNIDCFVSMFPVYLVTKMSIINWQLLPRIALKYVNFYILNSYCWGSSCSDLTHSIDLHHDR